MTSWHHNC